MSPKILALVLVLTCALSLPARAEDHAEGGAPKPATAAAKPATGAATSEAGRPDGDADQNLKTKAVNFLAEIFAPVPKSVIQEEYAEKIPAAVAAAKDGNGTDISEKILTPLFATLDTPSFKSLMDKVEKKIKEENGTGGTIDNRFIDLLEMVQKYGKDGVLDEKTSKTEKEKTVGDKFRSDFLAQQTKNKDLLAKAAKINDLKKANKPENAAEIAKLQDEVGRGVNQKALLSFLQTRGQVGKDLRDALAIKSDSGHNFLNASLANGQAIKLHLGNDAATADKVMTAYADKLGNWTFLPNPAATAKDFFVDATGKPAEGAPAGFKYTPPATVQSRVAEQGKTPPAPATRGESGAATTAGGPAPSAADAAGINRIKAVVAQAKCSQCHKEVTVSGNSLRGLKFVREGQSFSASDILSKAKRMKLSPDDIAALELAK